MRSSADPTHAEAMTKFGYIAESQCIPEGAVTPEWMRQSVLTG